MPWFYKRVLLEIGNGGLGPGPLYGVPPRGHFDDDLRRTGVENILDLYFDDRARAQHRGPRDLLCLSNWGAGKWSYLDCATADGAIVTCEWLVAGPGRPEGLYYWQTSPRLADWLHEWTQSDDPRADLSVEIIGRQVRKNPFTGLPREYPVTRPRGPMVDLSARI